MSIIRAVSNSIASTVYEPNLRNAGESNTRRSENLRDSVALSNVGSAESSNEANLAGLIRIVESQPDLRADRISQVQPSIGDGSYSVEDRIDTIVENLIGEM